MTESAVLLQASYASDGPLNRVVVDDERCSRCGNPLGDFRLADVPDINRRICLLGSLS